MNNPEVLSYDEYLAQRRKEAESKTTELDALAAEYTQAGQRYQESLRAFGPEYYTRVLAPRPMAAPEPIIPPPPVDEVLEHNYDGIQEYDNPTPGWWYMVFGGSVVFSLLYVLVYHFAVPTLPERHASAESRALEAKFAELSGLPAGEEKVLAIMSTEPWLARGETIFVQSCALCHQADGRGGIGPNLTDDNYKNIATILDISDFISEGSPSGAMPAQKNILNDNEIALVTAYVASLRGKNLPSGEGVNPDYTGQPIAPWPNVPGGMGSSSQSARPHTTQTPTRIAQARD